jgi:hypothetical protein
MAPCFPTPGMLGGRRPPGKVIDVAAKPLSQRRLVFGLVRPSRFARERKDTLLADRHPGIFRALHQRRLPRTARSSMCRKAWRSWFAPTQETQSRRSQLERLLSG